MSQNFVWTNEMSFKLIELFRDRHLLWDPYSDDFKNRLKKYTAWQEIGDYFNLERGTVEKKMKMLVGQFRREAAKEATTGAESRWYAYPWLRFLSRAHESSDVSQNEQSNSAEDVRGETVEEEQPAIDFEEESSRKRRRPEEQPEPKESMTLARFLFEERQARDQYTVFGEYVATKMRNIKSQHANATAQFLINKILYCAEIGLYDDFDGQVHDEVVRNSINVDRPTTSYPRTVEEEVDIKNIL